MDDFDEKILNELACDSGLTGAALGGRIGLSTSATHRRVKLLETAGLIKGYRAVLSAEALGSPSVVFVTVTLREQTREALAKFESALARYGEIREAHLMSGEWDYLLKVSVRSGHGYERVHRDVLSVLPGVQRLVSHFSIREVLEAR